MRSSVASNNNWQVNGPWAESSGANVYGGGGDLTTFGTGASLLDKLRMGAGQLPDAQYPDGYIQTVQDRYKDRLARELRERLTDRSYQRGIHKDTKMSPGAYYWPVDFNPESALKLQAQARREGNVLVCPSFVSTPPPAVRYRYGMEVSKPEMAAVYRRYGINAYTGQATDPVDPAYREVAASMMPTTSW